MVPVKPQINLKERKLRPQETPQIAPPHLQCETFSIVVAELWPLAVRQLSVQKGLRVSLKVFSPVRLSLVGGCEFREACYCCVCRAAQAQQMSIRESNTGIKVRHPQHQNLNPKPANFNLKPKGCDRQKSRGFAARDTSRPFFLVPTTADLVFFGLLRDCRLVLVAAQAPQTSR